MAISSRFKITISLAIITIARVAKLAKLARSKKFGTRRLDRARNTPRDDEMFKIDTINTKQRSYPFLSSIVLLRRDLERAPRGRIDFLIFHDDEPTRQRSTTLGGER